MIFDKGIKGRNEKTVIGDLSLYSGSGPVPEVVRYVNPRFNEPNAEVCAWDIMQQMPVYDPANSDRNYAVSLTFNSADDMNKLVELTDIEVTDKTKTTWFPTVKHKVTKMYVGDDDPKHKPKHPVYIVSKSRFEKRPTSDALCKMGVPHYIVVEQHQYEDYKSRVDPKWVTVLVLDQKFLDEYEVCDEHGDTKSKGPGAARNFVWQHAIDNGAEYHWVMDDNAVDFNRVWRNKRPKCMTGACLRAMEDHVERYDNVYIAGPNYRFFCVPKATFTPIIFNTRIYSCLFIKNHIYDKNGKRYYWRGRYNEDTDLSLRVLKDGHATMQFNSFLFNKLVTQAMQGGNTEAFYGKEGTKPKSDMLKALHPDETEVVFKFGRWHHEVDYSKYKTNPLGLKPEYANLPNEPYEYGMRLIDVEEESSDSEDLDYFDPEEDNEYKPEPKKKKKPKKMTDADMRGYKGSYQNLGDIPEEVLNKKRVLVVAFKTKQDVVDFQRLSGIKFTVKENRAMSFTYNNEPVDYTKPRIGLDDLLG